MGLAALVGQGDKQVVASYFKGKVVWITGASGGFGEALCKELCRAAEPAGLILSARREAELRRVEAQCQELRPGVKTAVLPLDLSNLDGLPAAAEKALAAFGVVDVLVNNGGVGFRGLAEETSLAVDRRVMDVDFFSGAALTKALLPGWLSRGAGHVVQISSVQAYFGLPGRTAYAAAKHAAVGFYDALRAEVEERGISVTVVGPGYIRTNHSQNAVSDEAAAKYPEGHTSKGVPPEKLAPKVLAATARRQPELVPAALDALVGRVLRTICPGLLFWIMKLRARKEQHERAALEAAAAASASGASSSASKDKSA